MKKVNFLAVLAVSTTLFLVSCGGGATEQPAAEETPVVEEAPVVEETMVEEEVVSDSTAEASVAE